MTTTQPTAVAASAGPSRAVVAGGLLVAALVAVAANTGVAAIAHGAGVSHDFRPLQPTTYGTLTVLGFLAGAAGWRLVRNRAADPRRRLRGLVPAVLVLSLIPDLLIHGSSAFAGSSWGAVVATMSMHFVVATVAVPTYLRTIPLPA
jgi:Family of unknown function (DUF6069)